MSFCVETTTGERGYVLSAPKSNKAKMTVNFYDNLNTTLKKTETHTAENLHRVCCFGIPKDFGMIIKEAPNEDIAYLKCQESTDPKKFYIIPTGKDGNSFYFIRINTKFFMLLQDRIQQTGLTNRVRVYLTNETQTTGTIKCDIKFINPLTNGTPFFADFTPENFNFLVTQFNT